MKARTASSDWSVLSIWYISIVGNLFLCTCFGINMLTLKWERCQTPLIFMQAAMEPGLLWGWVGPANYSRPIIFFWDFYERIPLISYKTIEDPKFWIMSLANFSFFFFRHFSPFQDILKYLDIPGYPGMPGFPYPSWFWSFLPTDLMRD